MKIINMAEKIKDADDLLLQSLFASEPVADDGFSKRVVGRIRRQLWLRRVSLPISILIGGAIALQPLSQLTLAVSKLLAVLPVSLLEVPLSWFPQIQYVLVGAMLLIAGVLGLRLLEE